MRIKWSKRGTKRLVESASYIATNFYPEYATDFRMAAEETVRLLAGNPELGCVAFPQLDRPEIRKILCGRYDYWVYYRVTKTTIDILSIRHTLMNIDSPRKL